MSVDAAAAGAAMAAAITGTDQAAPFTMVRRDVSVVFNSMPLKRFPQCLMMAFVYQEVLTSVADLMKHDNFTVHDTLPKCAGK